MYDLFGDHQEEQALYHSIATVGTLLLEIGEVGKKFYLPKQESSDPGILSGAESGSELESPSQSSWVLTPIEDTPLDKNIDQSEAVTETDTTHEISEVTEKLAEASVSDNIEDETNAKHKSAENTPENGNKQMATDSGVSVGPNLFTSQRSERTISSSSSKIDTEWSITFEQFLASMLTESAIVKYFEQQYDVTEAVSKMRNRRLLMRQTSPSVEEKK